jgi:SecD/SecF fusion protein
MIQKVLLPIELAGVTDPDRVRKYLQSTANLQFFEVYNISEIYSGYQEAEKALAAYLSGTEVTTDTSAVVAQTPAAPANVDTTKTAQLSDLDTVSTAKPGIDPKAGNQNPLTALIGLLQPQQGKDGQVQYPAAIGYVRVSDTGLLNSYLRLDLVSNKFPANLKFMFGKQETNDPKAQEFLPLYAVKTVEGPTMAKLEGEHVSDARQDFDERGRVAIKMNMDKVG